MFFSLLQSALLLTLAGLGIFAIQLRADLNGAPNTRRFLVGLVFGCVTATIILNSYLMVPPGPPTNAKAGLLVFAGYIGGPIAAAVATLLGAMARIWLGGPNLWISLTTFLALALVGLLVRRFIAPTGRLPVPPVALAGLVIGALLVGTLPPLLGPGPEAPESALGSYRPAVLLIGGATSVLVMSAILSLTSQLLSDSRRADKLGHRLELIARSARLGVFERKAGSDMVLFDAGMMQIYGMDRLPGLIPVTDWSSRLHPQDKANVLDVVRRLWEGTLDNRLMEFRITHPDGKIRHIRIHWVAERASDGTVARVLGIQEDITDVRHAELQRQIVEARLARVIANLPGVIISMDLQDPDNPRTIYVSPRCQDIWGVTPQEVYQNPGILEDMHDPADRSAMHQELAKAARTLAPFSRRFRITDRNGTSKWLETHTDASRLSDGSIQTDGIILDVTTEVLAQEQLEAQQAVSMQAQKNQSIGQLTGGVAHDFNNLLAVIMGNLELLRDDIENPEQQRLIDASIGATRRGADLTRNMLAFARKARLDPVVLDLNRLVSETRSWAGRTLPASISVETSLLAGLWKIKADPSSTESALLNLILNARDAMPKGGKLTIETSNVRIDDSYIELRNEDLENGRYVMLAVSDTGHGIEEASLAQIFEPFYSTKPPGSGSGLGLSMVEGFMRQSGGTVRVYSEPGVGTTFKLYFKAQPDLRDSPSAAQPKPAEQTEAHHRILVAEDEPEVLAIIVATLTKAGFHVVAAGSGDEALRLYQDDPTFDLLLTDIVMPGTLQGTTLSKALREQDPDLRVVFMSGYASEATVHGNGLRPEDIRLMKPVSRKDLLAALNKSLATPSQGHDG